MSKDVFVRLFAEESPWRFDEMTKEQREAHVLDVLKLATMVAAEGVESVCVLLVGKADNNGPNYLVPFTGQWSHRHETPDGPAIRSLIGALRESAKEIEKCLEQDG